MKIDKLLHEFTEKYDEEAMGYIDKVSNNIGYVHNKLTIDLFNINEAFTEFTDFISKYGKYKIDNVNNENSTPQKLICERVESNIKSGLFKPAKTLYADLTSFVESYASGIQKLTDNIETIKKEMYEAGVDHESIGDINQFTETFVDKLSESFEPAMDKILLASGYTTNKALFSKNNVKKEENNIFL